jgi:catechol 2,3-dioxygenase-like lactoylglutathione lyase family enzyme
MAKKRSATKTAPLKAAAKTAPRTAGAPKKAPQTMAAPVLGVRLVLRVVAVGFTANDLQKSIAWYCDVLGFSPGERFEREGRLLGIELGAGSVNLYLSQDDWKKGRDRRKGEGFRVYLTTVQNVDAIAARLKAAGATLDEEPHDTPWGTRELAITDPDGFKITIGT